MNSFECLEDEARKDGVELISYDFRNRKIKGLYCDGIIGINKSINTLSERACVLAEELGHHYTSVGDILNQRIAENRKQELQARMYAYNKLIGLQGLINCYEYGCSNIHEMAEYLNVTERFVVNALEAYEKKYGIQVRVENYIIRFNPNFSVIKIM